MRNTFKGVLHSHSGMLQPQGHCTTDASSTSADTVKADEIDRLRGNQGIISQNTCSGLKLRCSILISHFRINIIY